MIWKNGTTQNNSTGNSEQSNTSSPDNVDKKLSSQDKSIFNSNFDVYYGEDVSGKKIKALISSVEYSNANSKIGTVDLFINGEQTTDLEKVVATSTYSVNFEYNEDGLIYKIIVKENIN